MYEIKPSSRSAAIEPLDLNYMYTKIFCKGIIHPKLSVTKKITCLGLAIIAAIGETLRNLACLPLNAGIWVFNKICTRNPVPADYMSDDEDIFQPDLELGESPRNDGTQTDNTRDEGPSAFQENRLSFATRRRPRMESSPELLPDSPRVSLLTNPSPPRERIQENESGVMEPPDALDRVQALLSSEPVPRTLRHPELFSIPPEEFLFSSPDRANGLGLMQLQEALDADRTLPSAPPLAAPRTLRHPASDRTNGFSLMQPSEALDADRTLPSAPPLAALRTLRHPAPDRTNGFNLMQPSEALDADRTLPSAPPLAAPRTLRYPGLPPIIPEGSPLAPLDPK